MTSGWVVLLFLAVLTAYDFSTNARLYGLHTPDDIDFGVPHVEQPTGWNVNQLRIVYMHFDPSFDKRGTPDASCAADIPPFTSVGQNVDCDKVPDLCITT